MTVSDVQGTEAGAPPPVRRLCIYGGCMWHWADGAARQLPSLSQRDCSMYGGYCPTPALETAIYSVVPSRFNLLYFMSDINPFSTPRKE